MPVPDQVRDDESGIQNTLELLDSAKASLRARLYRPYLSRQYYAIGIFVIPGLTRNPVFLQGVTLLDAGSGPE